MENIFQMVIRYTIKLTKSEVEELQIIINKGSHTSQTFRAAYILLNCDEGEYSKKQFIEEGMEAVLERRATTRVYDIKADGDMEARLVTLCCSEPPKGFSKWSLRMLADKMVELKYVESISHVTVRTVLKKTNLSLGK